MNMSMTSSFEGEFRSDFKDTGNLILTDLPLTLISDPSCTGINLASLIVSRDFLSVMTKFLELFVDNRYNHQSIQNFFDEWWP